MRYFCDKIAIAQKQIRILSCWVANWSYLYLQIISNGYWYWDNISVIFKCHLAMMYTIRFLPLAISGQWSIVVTCVCRTVHPFAQTSVHLSVCKLYFVRTITHHRFGITKFAPNMHHGIFPDAIENEDHWPWTSMSFWIRILRNSACLHDNL